MATDILQMAEGGAVVDVRTGLRRNFECIDGCGAGGYDLYMVHDHIWRETFGLRRGILCFTCADTRIRAAFGRPLTPSLDLQALPCNKPYFLVEQNILAIEADRPKS